MSITILSFFQITSKSDEGSQRIEQGRLTVSETFASTSVGPKFKIWFENEIFEIYFVIFSKGYK